MIIYIIVMQKYLKQKEHEKVDILLIIFLQNKHFIGYIDSAKQVNEMTCNKKTNYRKCII